MALISLDDKLVARYQALATAAGSTAPIDQILARQLDRFATLPPAQRVVVVTKDQLAQVEHLLGGGQITTAAQLLERIEGYAAITIGQVALDFSPAQKAEIAHRAQKRGVSPKEIVQELVEQITGQLFWDTVQQ